MNRTIPRRDWDEIAAVATAAQQAGTSMIAAVAAHLDLTPRAAEFVIRRARNQGRNIPFAARGPKPDDELHAQVAAVANAAAAAGQPIAAAVAERFGREWRCATNLVSRARQRGHSIPYDYNRSGEPRVATADVLTLVCADCGHPAHSFDLLVRHTLIEHQRAPYRHERTPRT